MIERPFEAQGIPPEILSMPVSGRHLAEGGFGAQLEGRTLLIFLRHLG